MRQKPSSMSIPKLSKELVEKNRILNESLNRLEDGMIDLEQFLAITHSKLLSFFFIIYFL